MSRYTYPPFYGKNNWRHYSAEDIDAWYCKMIDALNEDYGNDEKYAEELTKIFNDIKNRISALENNEPDWTAISNLTERLEKLEGRQEALYRKIGFHDDRFLRESLERQDKPDKQPTEPRVRRTSRAEYEQRYHERFNSQCVNESGLVTKEAWESLKPEAEQSRWACYEHGEITWAWKSHICPYEGCGKLLYKVLEPPKRDENDRLIPEAEQKADKPEGYWWCTACKIEVDPHNVTYEERHDTCGSMVVARTEPEAEQKAELPRCLQCGAEMDGLPKAQAYECFQCGFHISYIAYNRLVADRAIAEKIRKHMALLETLEGNEIINKQAHNELIMLQRIVKGGE